MKALRFILIILFISILGCDKDTDNDLDNLDEIVGRWQLVKEYNLMVGDHLIDIENQRIEEYTKNKERILYDYLGNETARCGYNITDSIIIIFGENLNGEDWEFDYEYWFKQDTLVIHHDGGFEYYNEFFVCIE